jgi:ABC-type multidrug transport system fused ATPase/permease subunit
MGKEKLVTINSLWVATMLINILAPLANIGFAFSIKFLIDDGIQQNLTLLYRHLCVSILVVIVFVLGNYLAKVLTSLYTAKQIQKYRMYLMSSMLQENYVSFIKQTTSDYQHGLLSEADQISKDYLMGFFEMVRNLMLVGYSLVAMFMSSGVLAAAILILTAIPIILSAFSAKKGQIQKERALAAEKTFANKIKEILAGFLTIKIYQAEKSVKRSYQLFLREYTQKSLKLSITEDMTSTISEVSGLMIFLVAFGGGMIMSAKGTLSVGSVTAIVQLVNFVVMPINQLGLQNSRYQGAKALLNSLTVFLRKETSSITSGSHQNHFTQAIGFTNVSFRYPETKKQVLTNVNCRLLANHNYAIIGNSGSGKTTIFNLLLKLFSPDQGKITIDGNDLNSISAKWWYSQVAVVQQEVFIFNDSIKYNVTLGHLYSDQQIVQALQEAGLGEFLATVNGDLNYNCGENGKNLSGGQRQRISIARAFIQEKSIILLDEATSALDNKLSNEIEQTLLAKTKITVIVITHKTSVVNLARFDKVFRLVNKKLIEV